MQFKKSLPLRTLFIPLSCAILAGCSSGTGGSGATPSKVDTQSERQAGGGPVSPESKALSKAVKEGRIRIEGKARIAVLYYLDQPAHRASVKEWLKENQAEVLFENEKYGYIDAELSWEKTGNLIATAAKVGVTDPSIFKLELEGIETKAGKADSSKAVKTREPENTLYRGSVHSSGFGTKIQEFKETASRDLGLKPDDLSGQGTLVAIYDGGIDMSRTDVFGNRIRDVVVGDEKAWRNADQTAEEFIKEEKIKELPEELKPLKDEKSLRFLTLKESDGEDYNGNGVQKEELAIAVYVKDGEPQARIRPAKGMPFGEVVLDFATARKKKTPGLVSLFTGKLLANVSPNPVPRVAALKFRKKPKTEAQKEELKKAEEKKDDKKDEKKKAEDPIQVAIFGTEGTHGLANLHMVGGNFASDTNPATGEKVFYQGVATQTEFLSMYTWHESYGDKWIPLARNVINAAEAGADVIDLDIYTPGTRNSQDMLSAVLCRVTQLTAAVPVVAAHNYGPLPNTIQSLAQSPCVLGIGASDSVASYRVGGRNAGSIDPALAAGGDEEMQTTAYSGRGFGMNGMLKPDIISPAYGYVAQGSTFTRFGGTSGATPTTAGIIALLKQAARIKGVELGFEQVRFLLQGGSKPVRNGLLRDGYGFTNLAESWNLFKRLYDPAKKEIQARRFALSGHQVFQFNGKPVERLLTVNLRRDFRPGDINAAEKMNFSIEYGGASLDKSGSPVSRWLKFYQRSSSETLDSIEWDAPLPGNTERLRLSIQITDDEWAKLPPGDHIALVRGVRSSLAQASGTARATDFVLPVTISKPLVTDEERYEITPLYEDQYQIIPIETKPGDRIFVYGEAKCLGQAVPNHARGTPSGNALSVLIDHDPNYPHASAIMNLYDNLNLAEGPIRVVARSNQTRIALIRYSENGCSGAVGGTIVIRRIGLEYEAKTASLSQEGGKWVLRGTGVVRLTSGTLDRPEINHHQKWTMSGVDHDLVFKKTVTEDLTLEKLPKLGKIWLSGVKERRIQALLTTLNADGSIGSKATPDSNYTPGFETHSFQVGGGRWGLGLDSVTAGQTLLVLPALDSGGKASTPGVLEINDASEHKYQAELTLDGDLVNSNWTRGTTKNVSYELKIPTKLSELYPFALGDGWSAEAVIPIVISEQMDVGDREAKQSTLEIGGFEIRLPVPLR